MSFVPAFEAGIWNAWILAIVYFLLVYIPPYTLRDINKKMGQGEHYGKIETFTTVVFIVLLFYSIFLPLKLSTAWFYSGIFIYLLGLVIVGITLVNVATTPLGQPFTKGTYRYSRNPGYLGQITVFVGIGIASASWLYLLISAVLVVATYLLIRVEERETAKKLGELYLEYMRKTSRWIGRG